MNGAIRNKRNIGLEDCRCAYTHAAHRAAIEGAGEGGGALHGEGRRESLGKTHRAEVPLQHEQQPQHAAPQSTRHHHVMHLPVLLGQQTRTGEAS